MGSESQSHHRNQGPRFASADTQRALLWTTPRATETPRSLPTPRAPRVHSSSPPLPQCRAHLKSPGLSWPAVSFLLHPRSPLPRGPAISPHTTPTPNPGQQDLIGSQGSPRSSPRASGLPQPRLQDPRHLPEGGDSGWAGASSTSDTRGREGGERAHFIITATYKNFWALTLSLSLCVALPIARLPATATEA